MSDHFEKDDPLDDQETETEQGKGEEEKAAREDAPENDEKDQEGSDEDEDAQKSGDLRGKPSEPDNTSEYLSPIYALPPKVIIQEEGQMEVAASPAFQCLDDLFREGKLTGTKVALMKAKYTEMHEMLKLKRKNELVLLKRAKNYTQDLENQGNELEKADNFPESSNTEVSKLREILLKYNNELTQIEERQYRHDYNIECLHEEKTMVEREYERMPKQGEVEKKIEELKHACSDLKKEIAQRHVEAKTLVEDQEKKEKGLETEKEEYEVSLEEVDKYKCDLVAVNSQPGQIAKETDRLTRQKHEVDKKMRGVNATLKGLTAELENLRNQQNHLDKERFDVDRDVNKQGVVLQEREREFHILLKDYEYAKEREAVLLGDKATLDLNLRHINLEKKNCHDSHAKKVRDKDRDLRNLKKAELQFKVAEDNMNHSAQIYEKVKAVADSQPKDDGSLLAKRTELQRETDQTKRTLAQQNSLTAVETVKVEQSIAEEERLLYEQSDLRIEVVELTRLAAIKNDEREQKARDFMRAEQRFHRAVQDLKTKHLQISDHQKKYQEMQIKLKDFAKLYDIIKNERNKCVNLIQTSTQKAAEMREKIKILQNEIEILRTAVALKDKQLQKQKLKHVNAIIVRDSLRNEVAKQLRIEDEMREKREQQRMDIAKLNLLINQAEEHMVQLRKQYETAVQNRNDRGIQLIERNEEVCIFYEKVNIQDTMVRNGNVEMLSREEEIRFLNIQLAEENRVIGLLKNSLPNKRNLEQELVTLQIQLSQCQDRMLELEKQLENPNEKTRVRFLEGKDLPPADMQNKVEELEIRLSEKEEQLLEKDLIFEQVARISERVQRKADNGKDDTLTLAKRVNELQGKIKEVTRKMMALVSELSMHQANALRCQQECKEKESDLEQCYMRMEKGEPPSEEIDHEWQRVIRDSERRAQDKEMARMVAEEEEQYTIAGGVTTTAEPRPNAYIPDDDADLPIPRRYGKHAPFKPQEQGTNIRHIRKPIPKPIEI